MNTAEYNFFIEDCKKAIENVKDVNIEFDIDDITLKTFLIFLPPCIPCFLFKAKGALFPR